jgi:hypothetical protein
MTVIGQSAAYRSGDEGMSHVIRGRRDACKSDSERCEVLGDGGRGEGR